MKLMNKRKLIIFASILLVINGLVFLGLTFYFPLEVAFKLCIAFLILTVELFLFSLVVSLILHFFISRIRKQISGYKTQKKEIIETWQICHVKKYGGNKK